MSTQRDALGEELAHCTMYGKADRAKAIRAQLAALPSEVAPAASEPDVEAAVAPELEQAVRPKARKAPAKAAAEAKDAG